MVRAEIMCSHCGRPEMFGYGGSYARSDLAKTVELAEILRWLIDAGWRLTATGQWCPACSRSEMVEDFAELFHR